MNEVNLAGYLVGIGIHHADGSETYTKLDKPIHNRIVKTGINQLLMYNGTPTDGYYYNTSGSWPPSNNSRGWTPQYNVYPIFRNNLGNHYGCLHFCQFGTDNTPTKFFQTELNAPYKPGVYTDKLKTGTPYTYTHADDWNKVSIYITHEHAPVEEDVTVREIGYFGRCTRDTITEYLMFSRIALDEPIILKKGEYLFNTYKLVCTVDKEEKDIENFGGLEGINAHYRYCPFFGLNSGDIENMEYLDFYNNPTNNDYYKSCGFGFPGILRNGYNYYPTQQYKANYYDYYYTYHASRFFMFPQCFIRTKNTHETYNANNINSIGNSWENISFSTDKNKKFPAYNDKESNGGIVTGVTTTMWQNENSTHTFIDYDTNKNYRDLKLTMPKYNPDLNFVNKESIEIHYIRARGFDYKLGYYTWNEDHTEQTWNPTPIIKKVNEQIDFTVRTTITTDDTEAWQNGTLVEGEE